QGDRAGLRNSRGPRLCRRICAGCHAGGNSGGADRANQPGTLSDGTRSTASVLHRGHHRRTGLPARHRGGRDTDRPVRRHNLDVLFAHAGQDGSHAGSRACTRIPPAGPVRGNGAMTGEVSPLRVYLLHAAIILALFALNFMLPPYHHGLMARIMVLAVFAMGYNMLFGYAGLLSLGHAMFFAAGMYGTGLAITHFGTGVPAAFACGIAAGAVLAFAIGLLALRTSGVAFMIVTMMFSQVFYLAILYFAAWTGGDQGMVLQQAARVATLGPLVLDLSHPVGRYM